MKKVLCTFLLGFFVPGFVFAATTHHYVCTDFTDDATITCGSTNVVTYPSAGNNVGVLGDIGASVNWTNGQSLYFSATYTGTGSYKVRTNGDVNDGTFITGLSGDQVDHAFTGGTGNTTNYVRVVSDGTFNGTLSDICVSDTLGACAGGGGGGGGYNPTATSTQDQTQRNLFNGWIIYFTSMFGMIWLLRKH